MRVGSLSLGNDAVVVNGWALGAAMVAIAIAIAAEAAAVGKAVVCLLWQEQPRGRAQRGNKRVQGERSERAHAAPRCH
jgi:hypothetical protein